MPPFSIVILISRLAVLLSTPRLISWEERLSLASDKTEDGNFPKSSSKPRDESGNFAASLAAMDRSTRPMLARKDSRNPCFNISDAGLDSS